MRRPALFLAAVLIPAGLASAQAPTPAPGADPVLARVDGQEIRVSDLELEFRRLPEELRNMPPAMLQPLLLDQMITYQAKIISYNNDFRLMALTVIPPLILLLFMRRAPRVG